MAATEEDDDEKLRSSTRPPASRITSLKSWPSEAGSVEGLGGVLLKWAQSEVSLTLSGETGTGKDRLARAIHARSPRAKAPFVVIDCGSIATNLAESELFGHERGAFTGAITTRLGLFEQAAGGTLFLDEIGEMPRDLQPRLLRVLESRTIRRVGGMEDRPVDVRVISATNRDLAHEVTAERFRADLYFRLSGGIIRIPPLRARLEQLPEIVNDLLVDLGAAHIIPTPQAIEALKRRSWYGNVRELKNVLSCALAFVEGSFLTADHFAHAPFTDDELILQRAPLAGHRWQDLEREAIRQTLEQTSGNRVRAAERLGIAVSTLYEKLRRYGLE